MAKVSLMLSLSAMAGCATSTLLSSGNKATTRTINITLIEDQVIAFGQPSRSLAELPTESVVIAGYKNSYVLTQGGSRFMALINSLDAKNIQINQDLRFFSEKNDGAFSGVLPLSYVKLQDEISKKDLAFFIENGAEECSTASDKRMSAQRFCFNLKLAGLVYPAASNSASLKALSKPYSVTIYTQKQEVDKGRSANPLEKLVLFPFAVAFDVISFPFHAAGKVFD